MKRFKLSSILGVPALALAFAIGAPTQVFAHNMLEDEDTILIEKQPSQKIPYSKIVRKLSKRLFNFDTYQVLTFGKGKRNSVARSFQDFADRSKYRLNVRRDEVELKYTLNF